MLKTRTAEQTKELNANLKGVRGMECRDGKWFFGGEQVTGISDPFGGESEEKTEEEKKREEKIGLPCSEFDVKGQDYHHQKAYNKEDEGWDSSNQVKKITPIKSMTELKDVQEIKKMTPVNWIEEIKSMKEVKSIEEIRKNSNRLYKKTWTKKSYWWRYKSC
eukprot:TRINITY_DN1487_c0_g1_i1.p1 TRINITY_DN1487_c0_g1~~TRINITY_DN1487_c0_g1_i1.p1  ORF type:complete len:162 (-),score=38.95 TRINITY_DN1487_c0_g1_i1:996-1481(-)